MLGKSPFLSLPLIPCFACSECLSVSVAHYRSPIVAADSTTHNPEVVGSNPAPATKHAQLGGHTASELFLFFMAEIAAYRTKSVYGIPVSLQVDTYKSPLRVVSPQLFAWTKGVYRFSYPRR